MEDFFWSGSGDGPPEFLKKVHSSGKDGKEVIIKTETLIATVYVEGQNVSFSFQEFNWLLKCSFGFRCRKKICYAWIVLEMQMVFH